MNWFIVSKHNFSWGTKAYQDEELPLWYVALKTALQVARVETLKDVNISIQTLQQLWHGRNSYYADNALALESFGEFTTV